MRRFLATLCAAVVGLVLLAWPLGRVGLSCTHAGLVTTRTLMVADGALWFRSDLRPPLKPLDREHYDLEVGRHIPQAPPPTTAAGSLVPLAMKAPAPAAGATTILVRLDWLFIPAASLLVAMAIIAGHRRRRRKRKNLCAACGYPRTQDGSPCPECGALPRDAFERGRARPGRLLRDAGIIVFAVSLVVCWAAWWIQRADERALSAHRAGAFDYSWYLSTCQPHLDGSVAVALPGPGPDTLARVIQRAGPGATIVLLSGEHTLGTRDHPGITALKDVWLLGSGPEHTTLTMWLQTAERVRIEGVTIDCENNECTDIRDAGSLMLRNCKVTNYNSGAGGSNALFAVGSALLVESSTFDGKSGRASAGSRGVAFDLRGENRVYLRNNQFIDDQEIFRDAAGVVDNCKIVCDQPQYFTVFGGSPLWIRGTTVPGAARWGRPSIPFRDALDDLPSLQRLAAGKEADSWDDPEARAAARELDLKSFWSRLLLHPSPEVRSLAAGQCSVPPAAPEMALNEALTEIDQQDIPPKVALSILAANAAKEALARARDQGSDQAKANAAALLQLLDAQPPLPALVVKKPGQ